MLDGKGQKNMEKNFTGPTCRECKLPGVHFDCIENAHSPSESKKRFLMEKIQNILGELSNLSFYLSNGMNEFLDYEVKLAIDEMKEKVERVEALYKLTQQKE